MPWQKPISSTPEAEVLRTLWGPLGLDSDTLSSASTCTIALERRPSWRQVQVSDQRPHRALDCSAACLSTYCMPGWQVVGTVRLRKRYSTAMPARPESSCCISGHQNLEHLNNFRASVFWVVGTPGDVQHVVVPSRGSSKNTCCIEVKESQVLQAEQR